MMSFQTHGFGYPRERWSIKGDAASQTSPEESGGMDHDKEESE
jgi:hypothetical protein